MTCCPTCGQPFPEDLWRFDIEAATLLIDGRAIHLTPREAAFLGLLLKNFGKPVHRDRLCIVMYDDNEPDSVEKCIHVYKCHLVRKLEGTRLQINNHHGFGYSITLTEGRGA